MLIEVLVRCERRDPELMEFDGIYSIEVNDAVGTSPYREILVDFAFAESFPENPDHFIVEYQGIDVRDNVEANQDRDSFERRLCKHDDVLRSWKETPLFEQELEAIFALPFEEGAARFELLRKLIELDVTEPLPVNYFEVWPKFSLWATLNDCVIAHHIRKHPDPTLLLAMWVKEGAHAQNASYVDTLKNHLVGCFPKQWDIGTMFLMWKTYLSVQEGSSMFEQWVQKEYRDRYPESVQTLEDIHLLLTQLYDVEVHSGNASSNWALLRQVLDIKKGVFQTPLILSELDEVGPLA